MSGQLKFIDATVCIFNGLTRLLSMCTYVCLRVYTDLYSCMYVCVYTASNVKDTKLFSMARRSGRGVRRPAQLLPGGSTHTHTHTHTRSGRTGLCFSCLHICSIIVVKYQKDRVVAEKGRAHHLQRSHRSFVYRARLDRVYRRSYVYIVDFISYFLAIAIGYLSAVCSCFRQVLFYCLVIIYVHLPPSPDSLIDL